MRRPIALRWLPMRLRVSAWSRFYRPAPVGSEPLYRGASLAFAPGFSMDLAPGDVVSDSIAFTGMYELAHSRRISRLARNGGLLVDVGANLGYFSLLWVAAAPRNTCLAFEASPRVLPLLHGNLVRNGVQDRVTVIGKFAGTGSGSVAFHPGPQDQLGWGGISASSEPGLASVESIRCDDVVETDVALLKVDAEGADGLVLKGCHRLLRARRIREIWFEQHKPRLARLGENWDATVAYLRSVGYAARPISDPSRDVVAWEAMPG